MKKAKYFKIGDLVIYIFLIIFFSILILKIGSFKDVKGAKAEIWVDGELKYVYPLQEEEKNIFKFYHLTHTRVAQTRRLQTQIIS